MIVSDAREDVLSGSNHSGWLSIGRGGLVATAVAAGVAAGGAPLWLVVHDAPMQVQPIGSELGALGTSAFELLGFTGAIGILTMAVLEVAKSLTLLRGYFHRWQLHSILLVELNTLAAQSTLGTRWIYSARRLTVAWFDVPADQLIAQVSAIAEPYLERFVIKITARQDREPQQSWPDDEFLAALIGFRSGADLIRWADQLFAQLPTPDVSPEPPPSPSWWSRRRSQPTSAPQSFMDRARRDQLDGIVRAELERGLDQLHITLISRWRLSMRALSCIVAAAVAWAILATGHDASSATVVIITIGTLVLGGFLSWVAHDAVALVSRRRTGA